MRGGPTATEYRLLVQHSPVMIWRSGIDASCDYFNQTWLAFTGRTLEQGMGDGWAEGVHPDDLEPCVAYYLDHFRRREAFERSTACGATTAPTAGSLIAVFRSPTMAELSRVSSAAA
jgi:PAS domain S-box-containing protein